MSSTSALLPVANIYDGLHDGVSGKNARVAGQTW